MLAAMPDPQSRRWLSLSPRTLVIAGLAALAILPLVLPCWPVVNAASLMLVLLQVLALALALNNKVRHRALFAGFLIGSAAHLLLSGDPVTKEYVPTRLWFRDFSYGDYGLSHWWFSALKGGIFAPSTSDFVNAGQLAVSLLCGSALALLMQGIASRFAKAAAETATKDVTHRWHQFSLQTLLLYTVAASLALAYVAHQRQYAARENAAASQLAAMDCSLIAEWAGPHDWFWRPLLGYTSEDSPVTSLWMQDASPERLQLAGELRYLQELKIASLKNTSSGLGCLQDLRVLRSLELHSQEMLDESLADVGRIRSLRELYINAPLSGTGLGHLAGLHQLRELTIYLNGGDVPLDLSRLPAMPNLLSLTVDHVADEQVNLLARQPRLESLTLNSQFMNGSGLRDLEQCAQLRRLWIHAHDVMDLAALSELTRLEGLDVHGVSFADDDFERISHLPNLQKLSLEETELTDAGLAQLGRLAKLRYLNLTESVRRNGHPLNPQGFVYDAPATESKASRVSDTTDLAQSFDSPANDVPVDDEDPFAGMADLAQASGTGEPSVTDPAPAAGPARPLRPRRPSYFGNFITDASAPLIGQLTELEELGLEGTRITDAGLRQLLPLQRLKILDLNRTRLTDEGLKLLLQFPNLERVNVEMTKVTPAGVQSLQSQRPELDIITGNSPNHWTTILSGIDD